MILLISLKVDAQIEMFDDNVRKIGIPKALPYDSLRNISPQKYGNGDNFKYTLHHLIGQTLMYCGNPYMSYEKGNFEKGVYYRVDSILPDDAARGLYRRMLLTNISNGVKGEEGGIFTNEYNFKWIVLGHYEKIKSLYINKEFVFTGTDNVYIEYKWEKANGLICLATDTVTQNIAKESIWTCVGVQVKPRNKDDHMDTDRRSPIVLIFDNPSYGKHYCYLESRNGEPYKKLLGEGNQAYICGRFLLKSYYDNVKAVSAANKAKRKADLTKKFGAANAKLILEGKVKIGMTKAMCTEAWGHPYDINKTIGSWGVHEQWVYGSSYLYFENDILTSIQN